MLYLFSAGLTGFDSRVGRRTKRILGSLSFAMTLPWKTAIIFTLVEEVCPRTPCMLSLARSLLPADRQWVIVCAIQYRARIAADSRDDRHELDRTGHTSRRPVRAGI